MYSRLQPCANADVTTSPLYTLMERRVKGMALYRQPYKLYQRVTRKP